MTGRHRSPPPPPAPRPDWRWHTVAALVGLGILAPPVTLWAEAIAPDATARSQVSTVTRAERTDAGPLVLPTVDVVAPAVEEMYPTPSAPPQHTATASRGTRTSQTAPKARTSDLVAITTPPQQTVTPAVQPVTVEPAAAPPTTVAAATSETASAIPPEETAVVTTSPATSSSAPTEAAVGIAATAEVTP